MMSVLVSDLAFFFPPKVLAEGFRMCANLTCFTLLTRVRQDCLEASMRLSGYWKVKCGSEEKKTTCILALSVRFPCFFMGFGGVLIVWNVDESTGQKRLM